MKTNTTINGAEIESSSIQSVSVQADLGAKIDSITIEQIAGNITLRSKMEKGKATLTFSPYFDWGGSWLNAKALGDGPLAKKLKDHGFSDEQISEIIQIMQAEKPDLKKIGDPELIDVGSDGAVVTQSKPKDFAIGIPLPSFDVNADPEVDVRNFEIKNIVANSNTVIEATQLSTKAALLKDFAFTTDVPDVLGYKSAEITEARLRPIDIPSLQMPDVDFECSIPKFGSTQLPITIESKSGGSDIKIKLFEWKPRFRTGISIDLWFTTVSLWIEFGVDVRVDIFYRWNITLLRIALLIKNLFLNAITLTARFSNLVLQKIRIGLLGAKSIASRIS